MYMNNMQQVINESVQKCLFDLLRGSLQQDFSWSEIHITQEEFDALLKLAKRHEVQPIVAYALLNAGGLTAEQEQRCRKLIYAAVAHQERMDQELKRICSLLEEAGIPHMPLKGAVIRKFYPEPWMRTSGDIDILVKDAEIAAKLLVRKGFIRKETDAHEITLTSPSGIMIELHFLLIETDPQVNALLERVWKYSTYRSGSNHYEMEPEMLYYYHIAHMAKHMILGGCGIRFFVDTWLLNEKLPLDNEKESQLLCAGGLSVFAEQAERLGQVWFGNGQLNPLILAMENYVMDSGIFGSKSNEIKLYRIKSDWSAAFLR